jgi:hypothetical protein|tara:strand:- start:1579 stop:2298 length:720 start_codon:yes stop_codon:yes gene_type:complete
MRKLAFIPTRKDKERPIKTFLERAGWDVHYLVGHSSIFDAYTLALKDHKVMAKDLVIMCHDDIEVIMSPDAFNEVIDNSFDKNTGFVGVAGPKALNKTGCWWHGLGREFPHPDSFLRGCVWHGDDLATSVPTYYGGYGEVEVVDGLFMVAKGATLNTIKTTKPKEFVGDWDYYDMFYSIQANKKGKINKVIPLMILHHSAGEGAMKDEWNQSRKAFIKMYGDKFEDIMLPHQNQLPAQA